MFEVLNLTDAQKRQMERIKNDLEPEFEKNLDNTVNHQMVYLHKMHAEHKKQVGLGNTRSAQENLNTLLKEDPEFKKAHDEIHAQGKAFATQFRTKMFDVLTDEQWNRLLKLLDNPPEYIRSWRKKIKDAEEAAKKAGTWTPGPNSWRPGDPIPEGYRQQRNERGRFPRGEN
jgi:Ni/Co efflux regulator RcnB